MNFHIANSRDSHPLICEATREARPDASPSSKTYFENSLLTLTLQKSRIPQVQGIKAAAVVVYRKALIRQEMWYHRLP